MPARPACHPEPVRCVHDVPWRCRRVFFWRHQSGTRETIEFASHGTSHPAPIGPPQRGQLAASQSRPIDPQRIPYETIVECDASHAAGCRPGIRHRAHNTSKMTCAEVTAAQQSDGKAILRYPVIAPSRHYAFRKIRRRTPYVRGRIPGNRHESSNFRHQDMPRDPLHPLEPFDAALPNQSGSSCPERRHR